MLAPIAERGEGSKELNAWLKDIGRGAGGGGEEAAVLCGVYAGAGGVASVCVSQGVTKGEVAPTRLEACSATAWLAAERHFVAAVGAPKSVAEDDCSTASFEGVMRKSFIGDLAAGFEATRSRDDCKGCR